MLSVNRIEDESLRYPIESYIPQSFTPRMNKSGIKNILKERSTIYLYWPLHLGYVSQRQYHRQTAIIANNRIAQLEAISHLRAERT